MYQLTQWLENPSMRAGIHFFDGRAWERHSYAEFAGQVLGAATHLRENGVRRADRVALALPSGPVFARYFLGLVALGATPTPIAPPGYHGPGAYADFVQARLSTLQPCLVVTDAVTMGAILPHAAASDAGSARFLEAAEHVAAAGLDLLDPAGPDELALIQFTSGSSSAPRGVTLTAAAVDAQIDMLSKAVGLREDDCFSSWLPLHHDMGLIGLFMVPVARGSDLWLMRPEHFVRRPVDWLDTFGRRGATRSATPCFGLAQLARRVDSEQLSGMDFSRWQTLIVGADRISYPTLEQVYRLLSPHGLSHGTLTPAYGMAEATLAVTITGRTAPPNALVLDSVEFRNGAPVRVTGERRLDEGSGSGGKGPSHVDGPAGHLVVGCGHEAAGVTVQAVDEDGQPLPDGHVGELRVHSPALSRGYFGERAGDERFTPAGYRTGDLGFRWDGQIYVLGRVGDSVKINGRFVTAEDVELALAATLDVAPDRIAVVLRDTGDRPVALVAVQQGIPDFPADRVADVLAAFGLDPLRFCALVVARRAVPRTTSGKPRRGRLWQDLETGVLVSEVVFLGAEFPHRFDAVPAAPPESGTGPTPPLRVDLGGKGFGLTVIQSEHLPVPPFIVLGAAQLAAGRLDPATLRRWLSRLVEAAAAAFGATEATIGLAVRSSPPRSMPGMMDTLLGLGLRVDDVDALADRLGSRETAWETLVGQAEHLCRYVAGADPERIRSAVAGPDGASGDTPPPASQRWERLNALFAELTGKPYPTDRTDQVLIATAAVRDSWLSPRACEYRQAHDIPDHPGPAVVVQAMAYGAAAGTSGSGVVFSHNPITGEPGLFGEFLAAATGEALVSGVLTPQPISLLRERSPEVFGVLAAKVDRLYEVVRCMVDVEFVVERGRLWLVQVRPAAARPHVLNRVRVQVWRQGLMTAAETLLQMDMDALFAPLPAQVADDGHGRLLVVGLPASPGVCTGPLATTLDEVLAHPPGTAVLLRPTTEPGDFLAMMHAGALLTLQGGSTSHAAVVARELGLPAVVALTAGDPEWAEGVGDVTVCGTTGRVWAGTVPALPARVLPRPDDLLATASIPGTTMICLPAEDEPGRPCIVDSEGAPLAVIAESPALDAPACGLPPEAPLRVLVCDRPGDLPGEAHGHVVASGDRATAEAWALKGGEVVFLHPAPSGAAWSTELPDCQLLAVVLYAREQVEHAHWVLAARAVRALDPEDR